MLERVLPVKFSLIFCLAHSYLWWACTPSKNHAGRHQSMIILQTYENSDITPYFKTKDNKKPWIISILESAHTQIRSLQMSKRKSIKDAGVSKWWNTDTSCALCVVRGQHCIAVGLLSCNFGWSSQHQGNWKKKIQAKRQRWISVWSEQSCCIGKTNIWVIYFLSIERTLSMIIKH